MRPDPVTTLRLRRRFLASAIALALVAPPLAPAVAQSRPTSLADLVDSVAEAVVNISATQTVEDKTAEGAPDLPKGTPFDDMFEQFFKNHGMNGAPQHQRKILLARLRLRDRSQRHRDHQQSRRRRRQRHRRHLHGRAQAEGQGDRQGSQGRRRRAEGRERQAAEDRQVRRQRQGARRRRRDGGRQSLRPGRDGDRRHPVRAQPQYRERSLRRLPADRRLDQQGQFGRPAVQHAGRSDRHQHGDSFALGRLDRHRVRDALGHGAAGHRATGEIRRDASRLARRAHSAGRRRHRGEPAARDRARRARGGNRRERPGQARRLDGGRRDRQVRRQGHQGIARSAAPRRLDAGRQAGRGRHHAQGPGVDQDGHARPARGRREADGQGGKHDDPAGDGIDIGQGAGSGARPARRRRAQAVQTERHREGRRRLRRRARTLPPPKKACAPAT